ncbi:IS110 family transposase [Cohnella sp. AR92]|uniref:IS110 family transposase n=1 Tax=Cohnella sp. AR92 TaxID=648716 RepID=UPI000F8EC35C|nr:IS110 family transposase [Cohnella sp. AR92]RUS43596.1 IS110 family transposase [Cohnella sp. AR92]
MHPKMNHIYVGVDLHKEKHVAVVIDCWNEKTLGTFRFANKPSAFPSFVEQVKSCTTEGLTPVFGLEDVNGYGRGLSIYLTSEGYAVKSVNPSLANDKRKSNPQPKKNDNWDARIVAKILLDELDHLPDAKPQDVYFSLKHCVNRQDSLVCELTKTKKQLHNELSYHYPSYKKFFTDLTGKTALAFWKEYPSPHCLKDVPVEDLAEFLRKHSNNCLTVGKAMEIVGCIESDGDTKRGNQGVKDAMIVSYVRQVDFLKKEIAMVEEQIKELMDTLDYKLESMTGIELVTAADFIARIGDIRRFKNADKLAKYAGIAPYENSSGIRENVKKSKLGDRHLHGLFYDLAIRQLAVTKGKKEPRNPAMLAYYQSKLDANKTKKQAIVCVMRKLVNVIFGMMKHKTAYVMPVVEERRVG